MLGWGKGEMQRDIYFLKAPTYISLVHRPGRMTLGVWLIGG